MPAPPRCFSAGRVATEFTLCAIAWVLLHELGHAERDSDPPADWLARERELDDAATDWLRVPGGEPHVVLKRALGITVALIAMTASGIHTGYYDGRGHPFTYDRLLEQLERYAGQHDDRVWGLVVAILTLHLDDENIARPTQVFDTFYECAKTYRDALALQRGPNGSA